MRAHQRHRKHVQSKSMDLDLSAQAVLFIIRHSKEQLLHYSIQDDATHGVESRSSFVVVPLRCFKPFHEERWWLHADVMLCIYGA